MQSPDTAHIIVEDASEGAESDFSPSVYQKTEIDVQAEKVAERLEIDIEEARDVAKLELKTGVSFSDFDTFVSVWDQL